MLDPFAGSGTTLLACDKIGVTSYGYESHPLVNRIASAKLMWDVSVDSVSDLAKEVIIYAKENETTADIFPEIVTKCYDESNLLQITSLKKALKHYENNSKEYSIVWVGFVSMLN